MNKIMNPYGNGQSQENNAISIETSRAVAEVQAGIILAKRFGRMPQLCVDRILRECQRPGLAEKALYSYNRGGTDISGPSIRLAEVMARNWGNIDYGIKEIAQNQGESEMMAYAWDLETNVRQVKIFVVKHVRYTKRGNYALEDGRDIYEATANQGSRRLRACILGIIPGDVIDVAVSQCEETLKASTDVSPVAIKKMIDAFNALGVKKEMIERRIQRRIDTITLSQIVSLRKIYTSLQDNMSVLSDWFEIVRAKPGESISGIDALRSALKKKTEPELKPKPSAELELKPEPSAEPELKPKSSADSPAPGAQTSDGLEIGTNAGKKIPQKEEWNPYNEDLQHRYSVDKAAIIKNECEKRKINITSLALRDAHQLLRDVAASATSLLDIDKGPFPFGQPDPKPETDDPKPKIGYPKPETDDPKHETDLKNSYDRLVVTATREAKAYASEKLRLEKTVSGHRPPAKNQIEKWVKLVSEYEAQSNPETKNEPFWSVPKSIAIKKIQETRQS